MENLKGEALWLLTLACAPDLRVFFSVATWVTPNPRPEMLPRRNPLCG